MRSFFSILLWIYYSICFIFFFIIVLIAFLLTFPFDPYHQVPNRLLKGLGYLMIMAVPGWSVTVKGKEKYKGDAPTVFVANHQSFLDMPITYHLPWSMKWVAKKSLLQIPVLGWIIRMTGHLGIDRQSLRSVKILDKLVEPIQEGIPAMFFPEGTRTVTGEIKRFKSGAFMLAGRYNFRVQPIVLDGGYEALPAGSWKFNFKQQFTLSILDPLHPGDFESINDLQNTARQRMIEEYNTMKAEQENHSYPNN